MPHTVFPGNKLWSYDLARKKLIFKVVVYFYALPPSSPAFMTSGFSTCITLTK